MWPVAFEQTLAGALIGTGQIFNAYKTYANWHITDDARNSFVCTALQKDFDFVFFMDTDMLFPKGCLGLMLKHFLRIPGDEPVVLGGVYSSRSNDHRWHVYRWSEKENMWQSMRFALRQGVTKVDAIGTGCMLIDVNVFKEIKFPWFEYDYVNYDPEKYTYDRMSEDMVFCKKLQNAGIPLYADSDIICGHLHSVQIWPTEDGGFETKTIGGDVY